MNAPGFFPAANDPLAAPNTGLSADLDAMAAFILSLEPIKHSPYRAPDGSRTPAQVRGATLFKSSSGPLATNCATCHIPPIFSAPAITDAFRFWFDNPTRNFGYAVNTIGPNINGIEFWADEADGGRHGAILSITYALTPQTGDDCDNNTLVDDCEILASPALDANANGILDACEPGACCIMGECQPLTQAACTTAGGTFFDFIVAFFDGTADYNMDLETTSQDFFDFVTDFFIGCPA